MNVQREPIPASPAEMDEAHRLLPALAELYAPTDGEQARLVMLALDPDFPDPDPVPAVAA